MPWWLPAASPHHAALYRASALILAGIAVGGSRSVLAARAAPQALLLGVAAGTGLFGLLLAQYFAPESVWGLMGLLAVAALASGWIALRAFGAAIERQEANAQAAESAGRKPPELGWLETPGLLLLGAGLALGLESLTRPLRLLGGGTAADDAAFLFVGAIWCAVGAAAFAPLGIALLGRRLCAPVALAGAGASILSCLTLVAGLSTRAGMDQFLRNPLWKLDLSQVGMWRGDFLIAGRCLVLFAMPLGLALGCLQDPRRWRLLLFGAAAGVLGLTRFLAGHGAGVSDPLAGSLVADALATVPWDRAQYALSWTLTGAALCVLPARQVGPRRWPALLALAVAAVLGLRAEPARALPLAPVSRFQPVLYYGADAPVGLLTVETSSGGNLIATLDRQWITPDRSSAADDEACLRQAWTQVQPRPGADPGAVLFVGQLDPQRAALLRELGATRIDRGAPWWQHMAELERAMFHPGAPPAGSILDLRRLSANELARYRLVLVAPTQRGLAFPRVRELERAGALAWLRAGAGAARADWGPRVLLASASATELWIGVGAGTQRGLPAAGRRRGASPWSWLRQRPHERAHAAHAAATERLEAGAQGTSSAALARGLRMHLAAQRHSSPFETPAQRVELDDQALVLLRDEALAEEQPAFLRDLWNGLARILAEKREIDRIYQLLEPLGQRHADWEDVQQALIAADFETLDPSSAARRLEALRARRPLAIDLALQQARALSLSGEPGRAAELLRAALELQPNRRDLRRALVMARARAGESDLRAEIETLLLEVPDDEHLRKFLEIGPLPPVAEDFRAAPAAHDH